jgi:hypothetical protein
MNTRLSTPRLWSRSWFLALAVCWLVALSGMLTHGLPTSQATACEPACDCQQLACCPGPNAPVSQPPIAPPASSFTAQDQVALPQAALADDFLAAVSPALPQATPASAIFPSAGPLYLWNCSYLI